MYLLTKYIKSVLWGVAVRLSYIQDAQCLKVKGKNKKKLCFNSVDTRTLKKKKQVSHVNPESVIMYAEVGVCHATSSTGITGYMSSSEAIHLH
jgi:hypothetical protein